MHRVTRKQLIRQKAESWEGECNCSAAQTSVIEFQDSCDFENFDAADLLRHRLLSAEFQQGYQYYGHHKVIFETPTFYRSVTVTIEEIK